MKTGHTKGPCIVCGDQLDDHPDTKKLKGCCSQGCLDCLESETKVSEASAKGEA